MSLRLRLLVSIALVLALTLLFGSGLIYLSAVNKVATEMDAALSVGARTVENAVDDPEEAVNPRRQLELLVEDFNGNRHLRAFLMGPTGIAVDQSSLLMPSNPAPDWFNRLLAREPGYMHFSLPPPFARYGSIILTTDSHNEIDEVWNDFIVTLVILLFFCSLILALVYLTLGRPLRLLHNMTAAFKCIGKGDYSPHIAETGARELKDLARNFNEMTTRLAAIESRNRGLEKQLASVQEEERADLARDLHDEIGPLLFAMNIDISTLQSENSNISRERIASQLNGMLSTVGAIQSHVRSMLGRLRPAVLLDLGLIHAVENLVAFWSKRRDDVRIDFNIERESFGEKLDAIIYRTIQEALNNSLRHGDPKAIKIRVVSDDPGFVGVEIFDDGIGLISSGGDFGFGLIGMKERIESAGGSLDVSNRASGGVAVRAKLPLLHANDELMINEGV